MKSKGLLRLRLSELVLVVLSVLPAVMLGAGVLPAIGQEFSSEGAAYTSRASRLSPLAKLYQENVDRVVFVTGINVEPEKKALTEFFQPEKELKSLKHNNGTGFFIHSAGYVLTNAHGVMRCLTPVVELRNGSRYDAQVVAVRKNHDLAVLKIQAKEPIKAIPLEVDTEVFVGDSIATIGCPPGLKYTLSHGIISGVDRSTIVTDIPGLTLNGLLQTEAPINPGASGGPWLNPAGHAVGMTVSKRGDADNIAFGIPVRILREQVADILRRWLEERFVIQAKVGSEPPTLEEYLELLTKKAGESVGNHTLVEAPQVTEGLVYQRLGLRVRALDEETKKRFALRTDTGVVITEVDARRYKSLEHVPQPGDVLARLDNRRPKDVEELLRMLRPYKKGEKMDLVILRYVENGETENRTRIDVEHFEVE